MKEIRRRTRVVGAFPDGQSCLNLAARPYGAIRQPRRGVIILRVDLPADDTDTRFPLRPFLTARTGGTARTGATATANQLPPISRTRARIVLASDECTMIERDDVQLFVDDICIERGAHPRGCTIDTVASGRGHTHYWILRHLPNSQGIAFELDPQVFDLTQRNIARLDQKIELINGDYDALLDDLRFPADQTIVAFVAPPWGTALDEAQGLELRLTTPPISEVIDRIAARYTDHKILFATQIYEKVSPLSLADINNLLDWTEIPHQHGRA